MSTLLRATGDLIKMAYNGQFDIIVQGCNCHNTMGSGIAAQIRKQIPGAYLADLQTVKSSRLKLGTYSYYVGDLFITVNAYTQYDFWDKHSEKSDFFEYDSFEAILDKLATNFKGKRFGFPMIGMGLAGGDSYRIISMLEKFSDKVSKDGSTVTLVEFSG